MIKLMIDSASDISEKEAKELGIIMIPMTITIGGEEFLDGVNLLPSQFYEKLAENKVLPKTSQINSFRWEEEFEKHTANGDKLIVITISSKLSATYNSALQASSKFEDKVFVIDSLNACIGERLLGLYALRLINEGKDAKEIFDILNEKKNKINVSAVIGTLEYLKKGGRISTTVAIAGTLLSIKPLIGVIDGEVKMIGKAMGVKNALSQLNKLITEKGGPDLTMPHGVIWSGNDDSGVKKFVADNPSIWEGDNSDIPAYILGGTIGTHIGPGAIGIAFFEK